jgi:protein TonB
VRAIQIGGWALTVAVSAVAHAALLAAPLGRSSAASLSQAEPLSLEVAIETDPTPEPDQEMPVPNVAAAAPAERIAPSSDRNHRDVPPARPVAAAPVPAAPSDQTPNPLVADTPMPHFTLAISASSADVQDVARSAPAGAARSGEVNDDVPLSQQAVDTPAHRVSGDLPVFPAEAQASGVPSDVAVEMVVSRAGTVESVNVLRRMGHGLDQAAIAAARTFRFSPAMKQGRPVRVRVMWTMQFHFRQQS